MEHIAAIITALAGFLAVLGGAIKWLWNKIQKRLELIEAELEACREGRATHLTVIELLWQEIQRLSPESLVLARAKTLLDKVKNDAHHAPHIHIHLEEI